MQWLSHERLMRGWHLDIVFSVSGAVRDCNPLSLTEQRPDYGNPKSVATLTAQPRLAQLSEFELKNTDV